MRKAIMTSSSVNPLAVPADADRFPRPRVVADALGARRNGAVVDRAAGIIGKIRDRSCLPIENISIAGGHYRNTMALQQSNTESGARSA
jgi:hypothetical protein